MSTLDRLEQKLKFLRYPPLMLILVIAYAAGFIIAKINPMIVLYLAFSPDLILQGQVWRLFTFVMIPNTNQIFMALLTCFIYFSISRSLERVVGRWKVNFFLVTGLLMLVIFGFLYYLIFSGSNSAGNVMALNPYYLYAMLFVLFALIFPDARFLLMFIIPIRGKWMVFITLAMYMIDVIAAFVQGNFSYGWVLVFMIIAAVLSLMLFLALSGYRPRKRSGARSNVIHMNSYAQNQKRQGTPSTNYRHKCALCGRTDRSNPELDFRYCSKCQGAYEYCSDHLYTHIHVGTKNPDGSGVNYTDVHDSNPGGNDPWQS